MADDWQSMSKELIAELGAMEKRQRVDSSAAFAAMESRLLVDNATKHLETMKYLEQLTVEQFKTRIEVTELTRRVGALEGKKPNGHAEVG